IQTRSDVWYYDTDLPSNLDAILLIVPGQNRRGRQIGAVETIEECDKWNRHRIGVLRGGNARARELADRLAACHDDDPCGLTACRRCMRQFRRTIVGMLLRRARRYRSKGYTPHLLTLVLTAPSLRSA